MGKMIIINMKNHKYDFMGRMVPSIERAAPLEDKNETVRY